MSKTNEPGDIKVDVGALPVFARCLAPALVKMREAFQRGLGDAGVCSQASLTFDDAESPPSLNFHVEIAGEQRVFSERVISRAGELRGASEERGAACATAIKAGLIRPRAGT